MTQAMETTVNSLETRPIKLDETPIMSGNVNRTPTHGQSAMKRNTSLKKNTPKSKHAGEKLVKYRRDQIHFLSTARELLYTVRPNAASNVATPQDSQLRGTATPTSQDREFAHTFKKLNETKVKAPKPDNITKKIGWVFEPLHFVHLFAIWSRVGSSSAWEVAPTLHFDLAAFVEETKLMCEARGVAADVLTGRNKPFAKRAKGICHAFHLTIWQSFSAQSNTCWIDAETALPSCRHRRLQHIYSFTGNVKSNTDVLVYCMQCIQRVRADGSTISKSGEIDVEF